MELDEVACSNDWFMERHNRPLRLFQASGGQALTNSHLFLRAFPRFRGRSS